MKYEGYSVLLGCFFYNIVNGSIFIWGSISIYVASYFRLKDPNVTTSLLLIFSPIRGILLMILLPIGSLMGLKYGKKLSLSFGIILFLILIFLSMITNNYWIFVFCFASAFAINSSFGYSMIQEAAWKYFPKNRGFASGIVGCGYIFSTLLSFLTHYMVNSDDLKPSIEVINEDIIEYYYDQSVSSRVPFMLFLLLIIWSVSFIIAFFTVRYPSKEYKKEIQKEMIPHASPKRPTLDLFHVTFTEAFFSKTFITIILINSLAFFMDYQISFGYKQIGQIYNYSDLFITCIGSIYPALSSLSRIFFGYLSDKFEIKKILMVGLIVQAITFGLLPQYAYSSFCFASIIILYSISSGAHASLFNLLCIKVFGITMAGNMMNYLLSSIAAGNIIVFIFNYYLLPFIGFKLYFTLFMILFLFCSFIVGVTNFELIWKLRTIEEERRRSSEEEFETLRRRSTLMF